nr:NAD(P)/FAD-dependent oxidoreductase [Cellulomonas sp. JH27-2]
MVERQLETTGYSCAPWVTATDGVVPVLVVGAGQSGLAVAFGLRRTGVAGVLVIDGQPEGSAGPWATFARMHTLRTPKDVAWPTWGVSAATPREWFEARYGTSGWESIEYYPTEDWHAFLEWYRATLHLPVRFGTRVERIERPADGEPFAVHTSGPGGVEVLRARRVVLATGLEGAGGRSVPDGIFASLDRDRWAHTHDAIDFAALAGKRVGVLGGGTSAFDNAATALENGAATATIHMRRPAMPTVSPYRWMEFPGILEHYWSFSDEQKWAFNAHLSAVDQPATQGAVWRAYAFDTFTFRCSSPWTAVTQDGGAVVVTTPQGTHEYDFVIAATGVRVDLGLRPELAELVDDVATWGDRFEPPSGDPAGLARYPYLDDHFALQHRDPERHDDALARLYLFNHGARMSLGMLSHQISGLVGGAPRLVDGIARDIFVETSSDVLNAFLAFDVPAGVTLGRRAEPGDRRLGGAQVVHA